MQAAPYAGLPMTGNDWSYASAPEVAAGSSLIAPDLASASDANPALLRASDEPRLSLMVANLATYANAAHVGFATGWDRWSLGLNATNVIGAAFYDGPLTSGADSFRGSKGEARCEIAYRATDWLAVGVAPKTPLLIGAEGATRLAVSGDAGVWIRPDSSYDFSLAIDSAPPTQIANGPMTDRYPTQIRIGGAVRPDDLSPLRAVVIEAIADPGGTRSLRASFGGEAGWEAFRFLAGITYVHAGDTDWEPANSVRVGGGVGYQTPAVSLDLAILRQNGQPGVTAWFSTTVRLATADASRTRTPASVLAEEANAMLSAGNYALAARLARRAAQTSHDPPLAEKAAQLAAQARTSAEEELGRTLTASESRLEHGQLAEALLAMQSAASRGLFDDETGARTFWYDWLTEHKNRYHAAADAALAAGKPLEALLAAQTVLTYDPNDETSNEQMKTARVQLAGLLAAGTERQVKERAHKSAEIAADPTRKARLDAAYQRASQLFSEVRYTDCLRELQRLLAEDPGNASALDLYEKVLDRLGVR